MSPPEMTNVAPHVTMESAKSEKDTVLKNLIGQKQLYIGDTWYLVASEWFNLWKKYMDVGVDGRSPGPIDNSPIADPSADGHVMQGMQEELDYVFVAKEGYSVLNSRYGIVDDLSFPRKVVNRGTSANPNYVISVTPIMVRVHTLSTDATVSGQGTMGQLRVPLVTTCFANLCMEPDDKIGSVLQWYEDHCVDEPLRKSPYIEPLDSTAGTVRPAPLSLTNKPSATTDLRLWKLRPAGTGAPVGLSLFGPGMRSLTRKVLSVEGASGRWRLMRRDECGLPLTLHSDIDDPTDEDRSSANTDTSVPEGATAMAVAGGETSDAATGRYPVMELLIEQKSPMATPAMDATAAAGAGKSDETSTPDDNDVLTTGPLTTNTVAAALTVESDTTFVAIPQVNDRSTTPPAVSRQAAQWPLEELKRSWMRHITTGDIIDARCTKANKWFEARVLHVNRMGASGPIPKAVKIHYLGYPQSADDVLEEEELPRRLAPLYWMSSLHLFKGQMGAFNWRDALKEGDDVEVKIPGKWKQGTVVAVGSSTEELLKRLPAGGPTPDVSQHAGPGHAVLIKQRLDGVQRILRAYSEELAHGGTHLSTPARPSRGRARSGSGGDMPSSSSSSSSSSSKSSSLASAKSLSSPSSSSLSNSSYYMRGRSHVRGVPPVRGATGLVNLGNTCFMNSMLQCLSNTTSITDFFASEKFLKDLNKDNVLGHGGKLATSYASLMSSMWSGQYVSCCPTEFKSTIGEFQPQFAGYQQQDSQEFMQFLLDGLHEDCNRILKKPYVETVESDGRPDEVVSKEAWHAYKRRNESIMTDKCFGQLRSHVTCPECSRESVTFDAFSSLSLPLPVDPMKEYGLALVPVALDAPPVTLTVKLPASALGVDLKRAVARHLAEHDPGNRWRILAEGARASDYCADDTFPPLVVTLANSHSVYSNNEISNEDLLSIRCRYSAKGLQVSAASADAVVAVIGSVPTDPSTAAVKTVPTIIAATEPTVAVAVAAVDASTHLPPVPMDVADVQGDVHGPPNSPMGIGPTSIEASALYGPLSGSMPVASDTATATAMAVDNSNDRDMNGNHHPIAAQELAVAGLGTTRPRLMDMYRKDGERRAYGADDVGTDGDSEADGDFLPPAPLHVDPETEAFDMGLGDMFGTGAGTGGGDDSGTATSTAAVLVKPATVTLSVKVGETRVVRSAVTLPPSPSSASASAAPGFSCPSAPGTKSTLEEEFTFDRYCSPKGIERHVTVSADMSMSQLLNVLQGYVKTLYKTSSPYHAKAQRDDEGGASSTAIPSQPFRVKHEKAYQKQDVNGSDESLWDAGLRDGEPLWLVFGGCAASGVNLFTDHVDEKKLTGLDGHLLNLILDGTDTLAVAAREEGGGGDDGTDTGGSSPHTPDKISASKSLTLNACLDMFIERERMEKTESYYCSGCKQHVQASRKLDLWAVPDVLVVHLKRFRYMQHGRHHSSFVHREKISEVVHFPVHDFDLTEYVRGPVAPDAPPVYDLYAVSEHIGGMGGGHYTAKCYNAESQTWYSFNDSTVSRTTADQTVTGQAYVLFYKRKKGSSQPLSVKVS